MPRIFVEGFESGNLEDFNTVMGPYKIDNKAIRIHIPTTRIVYVDILIKCDYCGSLTNIGTCNYCGGTNI